MVQVWLSWVCSRLRAGLGFSRGWFGLGYIGSKAPVLVKLGLQLGWV